MIDVKSISGEVLVSVPILKDAVSHEELMTSDYIQLHWDSDKGDVLPLGAYIEHNDERYSLLEPYSPSRQNEGVFRHSPQFHSRIIRWQKIIVPVYTYNEDGVTVKSRELDWNFTGTPADAMYMVKQALKNELGEEWNTTLGNDLPETITIAAQSSSVWSILSEIAEQCETEWWAEKRAQWLHLSKCNHGVSVDLEVGKNVKVPSTVQSGQEYFTRFYAFGSSRNVTQMESAVQGSIVNKRLTLDPAKYPGGYKDIRGHFSGGVYVSDLHPEEVMVKSLYFDEVYPSSTLTIAEVRKRMRYHTDDDGNYIRIGGTDEEPIYDQYAIWYFKIPGFDFKEEMIIENLELSVAFKSGELRGREFALTYHPKDKKVADKADVDKEFSVKAGEYEITFDESDYLIVPGVSYIIPHDGDDITVFNIEMPQEYKESAYLELERELDKEIDRLTKDNKSYEVDSNPVAFYEGGIDIHLGQSVNFTNNDELLATRVMMVEKHLDYPFEQKMRIGNEIVKGSRQQLKDEVRNVGEEVRRMNKYESSSSVIQKDHSRELMLTMGRYLAMKDTLNMLQGAVEGYTDGINPVTVETMALLVGNEALQFKFTASRNDLTPINCPLVYNEQTKQLNAAPCALIHLTLGINTITVDGIRTAKDYKSWAMEEWHSQIFVDTKAKFYVYAKVEENGTAGTYVLSASPVGMRAVSGYYHLLIGILNAEYSGTRELLPLYGFTQILPGQITTDVIRSADGSCYFDLAKNEIGGRISFVSNNQYKDLGDWANGTEEALKDKLEQSDLDEFSSAIEKQISDIQHQVDGSITTWFYDPVPTLDNAPANGWNEDEKAKHLGDLYYSGEGKAYRFQYDSDKSAYYWNVITDEDITEALALAKGAQDTADKKRRVFIDTPKPPYDEGDLWSQGATGDLMVCSNSRESGSFVSSDWDKASKYTDDTLADEAKNIANTAKEAADRAQEAADSAQGTADSAQETAQSASDAAKEAKDVADGAQIAADEAKKDADAAQYAADKAKEAADKAQETANAANEKLNDWGKDGFISPLEQEALRQTLVEIQQEYAQISAEAIEYNISSTQRDAYQMKTRLATTALKKYSTATADGSSIAIGDDYGAIADYYEARTTILGLISAAAKAASDDAASDAALAKKAADAAAALADAAQQTADSAQSTADSAQEAADNAKIAADSAQEAADTANRAASDAIVTADEAKDIADSANEAAAAANKAASDAQEAADLAQETADAASESAARAREIAAAAQSAADDAKSDAANAKADADAAKNRLESWADDSVLSPSEKQAMKNELAQIKADYNEIDDQIAIYSIENETTLWNSYDSAYDDYYAVLDGLSKADEGTAIPSYLATRQTEYYAQRTAILEAIAKAAKKVADEAQEAADAADEAAKDAQNTADNAQEAADDAQEAADKAQESADAANQLASQALDEAQKAKLAADAAKAATDALNDDGQFTVAEKRSVRQALKDINPSEGSSVTITNWTVSSRATVSGNAWKEVTDEKDQNYGWYVSDMHVDGQSTITRVTLNVSFVSDVQVSIMSRAETNFDYTLLSLLDKTLQASDTYQTTDRVATTTRGKQGQIVNYTFKAVPAGVHTFTVMYRKDGSTQTLPDNGYYKIEARQFAPGSIGDWFTVVTEKGLDEVICDNALDAADELFKYLDETGNVWENVNDEVPEGFRAEVYSLFQNYYKEVTFLLRDSATSDLDYLAKAMRNGKTIVDGGLVMTSLVAVGDTETTGADVEAFMNGSDFAKDTSHGKLLHALGIPEETEAGSSDLEARAKEAKTRMYEDGTVITQLLKLLEGCKLGDDIEIRENGIYLNLTGSIGSILMNKYGIAMQNADGTDAIQIGHCAGAMIQAFSNKSPFCPISDKGIAVEGEAVDGYAFYSQNGMFAGLRTNVKVVTTAGSTSSRTALDMLDFSVLIPVTSGTYYIKLPTSPQVGQEYLIESRGATLNITASQSIFSTYSGTTTSAGVAVTQSGRSVLRLKYYGSSYGWSVTWMSRN